MQDLKDASTHFAFGRNWASYAERVGEAELAEAVEALRRLGGTRDLAGLRFLDIGCGSGVHSLAAIRLGAREVVAIDLDADSVATTASVLAKFAPGSTHRVERLSVFDLDPAVFGTFDVVYSWGVLHHTGDMAGALARAAAMVAPGGRFLLALYRRTYLCSFWRLEKKWYASASPRAQRRAQRIYLAWHRALAALVDARNLVAGTRVPGGTFADGMANYRSRGMDFHHDVHDWLGGYPYESILPAEVDDFMNRAGLVRQASFLSKPTRGRTHGLLGSGCDEYRYGR